MANLDPLGLHSFRSPVPPPELDYKYYGFTDADLDRVLSLRGHSKGGHKGFLSELADGRPVTLRQVVDKLKQTYCQTLGVEYMHMSSRDKCNWIRARVETPLWLSYSKEKKLHIFERLAYADHFERFLGNKYNTAKRFGLDGGEAVIPGLKVMIDRASEQGVTDFVFGMPHRGRLNVLVNVLRKPMQQMFQEFQVRRLVSSRVERSVGWMDGWMGGKGRQATRSWEAWGGASHLPSMLEAPFWHAGKRKRNPQTAALIHSRVAASFVSREDGGCMPSLQTETSSGTIQASPGSICSCSPPPPITHTSALQGTHYRMEKYGKKKKEEGDWSMSGDVKYHLGTSMTRSYPDGRTVHLSLLANPSHLEVRSLASRCLSRFLQCEASKQICHAMPCPSL